MGGSAHIENTLYTIHFIYIYIYTDTPIAVSDPCHRGPKKKVRRQTNISSFLFLFFIIASGNASNCEPNCRENRSENVTYILRYLHKATHFNANISDFRRRGAYIYMNIYTCKREYLYTCISVYKKQYHCCRGALIFGEGKKNNTRKSQRHGTIGINLLPNYYFFNLLNFVKYFDRIIESRKIFYVPHPVRLFADSIIRNVR